MLNELFSIHKPSRNRGFTLIELLVVISIIGMLSSVAFGSFHSAQVKATNAKNIDVIRMYIFALESYRNDFGHFPIGPNNPYVECFSDRTSNTCGYNGNTVENSTLYTALSSYISPTTALARVMSDTFGASGYFDGPIFNCVSPILNDGIAVGCSHVQIVWIQKYIGDRSICGPGMAIMVLNDIAVCRVTVN